MKKTNLLLCILFGGLAYSQVGVNTTSPKATFDVTAKNSDGSTAEGIIAPRLTGDSLFSAIALNTYGAAQHGAIVYVTEAATDVNRTGQTVNVDFPGYYYFDADQNAWHKFGGGNNFYNSDGTLSGLRHVTMDGNNLGFTGGRMGVGTSTPDPSAILDLTSTSLGFLPPRMTKVQMDGILHPSQGLVIYCTDCFPNRSVTGCLMVNDSTDPLVSNWGSLCSSNTPNGEVLAIDCSSSSTTGNLYSGVVASGVSTSIPYSGGNGGAYSAGVFNSSGVIGLTANLTGGSLANGSGNFVFTIEGTPSSTGTASFNITVANKTCSFTIPVIAQTAVVTALNCGSASFSPATITQGAAYSGTLTVPYTGGNGAAYPAQSLPVNGLTFTRVAGTLGSGNGSVVYNVSGTPTVPGVMSIPVSLGGRSCSVSKNVESQKTVVMCGRRWMSHNLGANTNLDPHNMAVGGASLHGNYYQWGRITPVANASTGPGAISGWNTAPAANGSWGASKTSQDPCPAGFRVPTQAEWQALVNCTSPSNTPNTWGSASTTQYGNAKVFTSGTSKLTLPAAGLRNATTGALDARGSNGYYWSSTVTSSTNASHLYFGSGYVYPAHPAYSRSFGLSVRCIAE